MKLLLDDKATRGYDLNANEACIFAAILKCTRSGRGWYGNYRELAAAMPFVMSHETARRAVQKLLTLGLIERKEEKLFALTQNVTSDAQIVTEPAQIVTESAQIVLPPYPPINNYNNKIKESSVSRKDANTQTHLILTKKYNEIDMETLSDALSRKDSMQVIWSLLAPAPEYQNLYADFMRYWNKIERERQLQIWFFLKRKIDNKQPLDPNPFEVLKSCKPYPVNYNGDNRIDSVMKSDKKMVKAYHQGSFGIYELMDARLWHMTRIEPLNFRAPENGKLW